jgi:hypothetical protein
MVHAMCDDVLPYRSYAATKAVLSSVLIERVNFTGT